MTIENVQSFKQVGQKAVYSFNGKEFTGTIKGFSRNFDGSYTFDIQGLLVNSTNIIKYL
jgi:hypothetical protein